MATTLDLGPFGLTVDRAGFPRASELEDRGWPTFWIAGGQLDTLERIAELLDAGTRATVVPAIIPVGVHPAAAVAELYHRLAGTAPGRFVAGIGGPQTARPLAGLNAFLDDLDERGVPDSGRLIAALGPRKLDLARDRAAGAITLLVTPEHTRSVRAALGPDATLVVDQPVVLDPDPERGRAAARETVGFLAGVAGYRRNFERMGFTDTEIAGLDDRLIDAVVARGGLDAVVARLDEHRAAGADHVIVSPLGPDPLGTAHQLAPALLARITDRAG